MSKMDKIKISLGAVGGAFFSFFGTLAIPLLLLVGCNIIDWFTGLANSYIHGEKITSAKSLEGIAKKVVMYILVFVGFAVDILIEYVTGNFDIPLNLPNVVACVIAVWLVLNELISITENCDGIGVNLPFLSPIIKLIKGKMEDMVKLDEIEESKEDK